MQKKSIWAEELHAEFEAEDQVRWCFGGGGKGSAPPPPPPEEPEKPKRSPEDPSPTAEARRKRLELDNRTGRSGLRTDLKSEKGAGVGSPTRR